MAQQHIRTPWDSSDYGSALYGFAAGKLADSGVAPIVAVARGYRTITKKEELSAAKQLRSSRKAGRPNTQEARILTLGGNSGDTLSLPWYSVDDVEYHGRGTESAATQYRRSVPERDASGRERKYELRTGDSWVIDVHPATPPEWFTGAPRVLMVEGLAKGDSGLTSILLDSGISPSELAVGEQETRKEALERLSALMLRVPEGDQRTLIASIGGVDTWRATSGQWRSLAPRGRTVLVAFDGDLRTNPAVWNAADRLFEHVRGRGGTPVLLDLGSPDRLAQQEATDPSITERLNKHLDKSGARKRLGLDDYLTRVGGWDMLESLIVDRLPDKPDLGEQVLQQGQMRVTTDGFGTEVLEKNPDGSLSWLPAVGIGGRIIAIESSRSPQSSERLSGVLEENLPPELSKVTATLELNWITPEGRACTVQIEGTGDMLVAAPEEWTKKGVSLPPELLAHEEFPPNHSRKWLAAIKGNRREEIEWRSGWNVMGWVPTDAGIPAFIVGNQVLADSEDVAREITPSVTDKRLPVASRYGLIDTYDPDGEEAFKEQVRQDIVDLYEKHYTLGGIIDQSVVSAIVACMFRPTIPLDGPGTVYWYGPPGCGKSLCASGSMSAWSAFPGAWDENRLPGQADDTAASRMLAMSMTPIWVADDLAVQNDALRARSQEDAFGSSVRGNYNSSGKMRSTQGGTALADTSVPIAMLIGTGENDLTVPSVKERCVTINLGNRALFGEEAAVNALRDYWKDGEAPSRLCAAMIRFWLIPEITGAPTWEARRGVAQHYRTDAQLSARDALRSFGVSDRRVNRPMRTISELTIVFYVLFELGLWAGLSLDHPAMQKFNPAAENSSVSALHQLALENARTQTAATPGILLAQALHTTMQRGRAHIVNLDNPDQPPFPPSYDGSETLNLALGWSKDPKADGAWIPRGDSIGFIHESNRSGETELLIMLYRDAAFDVAKRTTDGIILGGSSAATMYQAMWTEGMCSKQYAQKGDSVTVQATPRSPGSDGTPKPAKTSRVSRQSAVPVQMEVVVNPIAWQEERTQRLEESAAELGGLADSALLLG